MGNRSRRRSGRPSAQETIETIDRFQLTPGYVLQEMALLAFSNIGELFDAAGHLKPVAQWSEDAAAAVASVDVTRYAPPGGGPPGLIVKVRLWDKLKALELLCEHFGLMRERVDISGHMDIAAILLRRRTRPHLTGLADRRAASMSATRENGTGFPAHSGMNPMRHGSYSTHPKRRLIL